MNQRVLVLTNNIGGLYSFRKEVIKSLVDAGYEVYISEPDDDERVNYFKAIGCHCTKTIFNRRGMNPFADMKLMMAYWKMIKRLKPMVVLSYTIKPNVYGGMACRLTNTPQIVNVTGLGDSMENGGWLQKLTVLLYKVGINKAKQVFFQNKSNRDLCIRLGIADERSQLLPGSGVNLQYHTPQPYPIDDGHVRFLFIGRLLKDKGIEEYFEAARMVKAKYSNTEFHILGKIEGQFHDELEDLMKDGIVNYLGTTIDVRPYIGAVECTVMPSYHEGMSNVNLESAANCRPVITTNIPGCRETVDDERTGYYVKARDAKSLADAMERFVRLPYSQKMLMGEEARKKVEREFNRDIIINAYLKEIININNKNVETDSDLRINV